MLKQYCKYHCFGDVDLELAVETSNLTKKYGSLVAVNSLDLKVEADTIHGFLGPNGASARASLFHVLAAGQL